MSRVDIGFIEKCESWRLQSRFFPNKIGQKPAWLDLKNIPDKNRLSCDYCRNPCIFLCQIYAPFEEDENAFHRIIYLFICKDVNCCRINQNGNIKVLRSQLKRINDFYPPDPPEERENWRSDLSVEKWTKVCHICGIFSTKHCAKCKKTNYCSRLHQILDWNEGHKKSCGTSVNYELKNFLFPEFELIIGTEKAPNYEFDDLEDEEREMKNYQDLIRRDQGDSSQSDADLDSDLINMANDVDDEAFSDFRNRIKDDVDQVLRYDRGGSPLYISLVNRVKFIPKCEECDSERQFEFQIMPQLINYLGFTDPLNSLDWGIIAVFTCKNSCVPTAGYASEWAWKQDIVKEQIEDVCKNSGE